MNGLWQKVLESLREKLNPQAFLTWIEPIRPLSIRENEIEVEVPNRFFQDWIRENYLPLIETSLQQETERHFSVSFVFKTGGKTVPRSDTSKRPFVPTPLKRHGSQFNPKYTFDNFVVGPSNQFTNAACISVANLPGKSYNPLFVYGGVGLGKTHLLHGIGNHVVDKKIIPDPSKLSYYSAEDFTNELVNSIRHERLDQFRNQFRNIEILLIDDVQFIAGKERTQEEFFHVFNSLYENRKQIVVTSDKFPRDIPNFEERLRSRFEWGLIADIQPPDVETKVAILKKKAALQDIDIPNDVAFFLAKNIDSNVRVLEGSLVRLGAFASLTNTEITLEMAREALKNIIKEREENISVDTIQRTTAAFHNIRVSDLKAKKKNKSFVIPRQIAMYICRKLTRHSLIEIGEKFGGKDHTTVIHSIRTIEKKRMEDRDFRERLDRIIQSITN